MTINGVVVLSVDHLEELIADMDDGSKEGIRILYQQEQE
jgi:hypothetical protein